MTFFGSFLRLTSLLAIVFMVSSGQTASATQVKTQTQSPTIINQTPWFNNPQIRQELKLNNSQATGLGTAYQNAWQSYQQAVQGLDKNLTAQQRQQRLEQLQLGFHKNLGTSTNKILTDPTQQQRFNQLNWQYRGYGAFSDPAIADKLKLTTDQRNKLNQFQQEWNTQMDKMAGAYKTDPGQVTGQFRKLQAQNADRINSVLTPEQQATWRQMIGNPYSFGPAAYFGDSASVPKK